MSKQKFNTLVTDPQAIQSSDIDTLRALSRANPYSQIIHALLARALSQAKDPEAKAAINHAAMYATDRQVLKELVTNPTPTTTAEPTVPATEPVEAAEKQTKPKQKKVEIDTSSFDKTESDQLRSDIWSDLEALKRSKELYMDTHDHTPTAQPVIVEDEPALKSITKAPSKAAEKSKKTPAKKTAKAAAKTVTKKPAVKKETKPKAAPTKAVVVADKKELAKTKTKAVAKTSKKEVVKTKTQAVAKTPTKKKPEVTSKPAKSASKVEDQKKIIDQFIDKEPSISSRTVVNVADDLRDLSERSTSFSDDLISENLAVILVDQGKKEKAVDMYKKLIWKFPQKKAYFAAQIEKLNKE